MDSLPFYQLLYFIFIAHYPDQVVRFEHRIVIRCHQRIPVTFDRNDQAVVPPSYVRLHDTLSEERETVIDYKRIDRNLFRLTGRTIGTVLLIFQLSLEGFQLFVGPYYDHLILRINMIGTTGDIDFMIATDDLYDTYSKIFSERYVRQRFPCIRRTRGNRYYGQVYIFIT